MNRVEVVPIDREWLYEQCYQVLMMEIESLESAGINVIKDRSTITHICNICTDIAVREVTEQGLRYSDEYTPFESNEILDVISELVMEEM